MDWSQEKQKRSDYFHTFYGSPASRRVFADIRDYAQELKVTTPESAIKKLTLLDLIESIKKSCGIDDMNAVVNAEMNVAASQEPQKPDEKTILE